MSILFADKSSDYNPENYGDFDYLTGIGESVYHKIKENKLEKMGISEKDFQKQMNALLQAKENKDTLGKTDMLNKIADIKNARTGGK